MTEEQYENLVDMFSSAGWKLFIEDKRAQGIAMLESAPQKADSNDKWQYCRGQIAEIQAILGFETFIRLSWEESQKGDLDVDSL